MLLLNMTLTLWVLKDGITRTDLFSFKVMFFTNLFHHWKRNCKPAQNELL